MHGSYATLVRRELWEHRSLWIAPVAVVAILLALSVVGAAFANVHFGWTGPVVGPRFPLPAGTGAMRIGVAGLTAQIFLVSSITSVIYLLDCLHGERKDRSILFWKSLPVSDSRTVLTKFSVAMLVVPLGVFMLALVAYPAIYGIAAAGVPAFSSMAGDWDTGNWLRAEGWLLASLLVTLLWYAPAAAWAMLASVLTRRTPMLLAVLPVALPAIFENLLLGSTYIWRFIGGRLVPVADPQQALLRPGLWAGLAAAAGMLYIVSRLRRYRDDT